MKQIQVRDKTFEVYIPGQEIEATIARLAKEIEADMHDKDPLFLVILNGAFMFAADLFKALTIPCEVSFARLSSYQGMETTNKVRELIGAGEEVKGRHVVIIEDIIDTGITLEHLQATLQKHQPASIQLATMLYKPESFQKDYPIQYIGLEIGNDFVVGYGLDYDGHGRNLSDIYKVVSQ
ncbi:MAG: hypoxanthine phosphoribosyltransferase [Bacteroidota bacterium]